MTTYLITYRFRGTWQGHQRLIQARTDTEARQVFLAERFGRQPRSAVVIESIDPA